MKRQHVVILVLVLLLLGGVGIVGVVGVGYLLYASADDPPESLGKMVPGLKLKTRERRSILPGMSTTQPPPQAAITSSQCGDLTDGGPVTGPGCISGRVTCGDTIIGHTLGGGDNFSTRFYEAAFCTPATTNHDGGNERVYQLEIPTGDWRVQLTLDTPCADLDMAAIEWDETTCPPPGALINRCEMWPSYGTAREKIVFSSRNGSTWLVAIEGKVEANGQQNNGAFALHVQCQPGL